MTSNEIVLRDIPKLERYDVLYMLVGSYSSNTFGVARSTQDVDFVIEPGGKPLGPIFSVMADERLLLAVQDLK